MLVVHGGGGWRWVVASGGTDWYCDSDRFSDSYCALNALFKGQYKIIKRQKCLSGPGQNNGPKNDLK